MTLHVHSHYSFKYGIVDIDYLINYGISNKLSCICLTDINSTSGCIEFIRKAKKNDLKPLVGIDFRNGNQQQFISIAKNNKGFKEQNKLLSKHIHSREKIPDIIVMKHCYVIYPYASYSGFELKDNEYLGVTIQDLANINFPKYSADKLVINQPFTFRNKLDYSTHRLLRAIDKNELLSKLAKEEQGSETDLFYSSDYLMKKYSNYPELINTTQKLLASCKVDFDFEQKKSNNQQSYTGSLSNDYNLLEKLTYEGLDKRYKKLTKKIKDRVTKELSLIKQRDFTTYYLINWDIVNYAKQNNIPHVGRGSGANSIIAYLLGITEVDPIELDLYFERFINLHRASPPDFDIDFAYNDRPAITQYIFDRFEHVALIGTYNTFQYKASVFELSKVFGLPEMEVDKLRKESYTYSELGKLSKLVLKYAKILTNKPSHCSVHSAGIVIAEQPITNYCATFMPPKGFATMQLDMHNAEDIKLFKFDILSQTGLAKIKDAVALVKENYPADEFDINDVKAIEQDPKVKAMISQGKALGCFYVESPAMRALLIKLKVDTYLGLVAASSIIRPGVAKSGMMQEYIHRSRNPEKIKDAHPILRKIMPETYGIMVYQEDVIKVAHLFGGLTLAEADVLRRGMSGKFRSREEFQVVENKFFSNCKERGYTPELTKQVWFQIESFAGYAFAKGHSASYSVQSYQCVYLKAYYPLEYMVSTINNAGGFYHIQFYIHEVKMLGASIHPPCINTSNSKAVLIKKDIYLGFNRIAGLDYKSIKEIVSERNHNGLYQNLDDFLDRVNIGIESLTSLIRINAFRSLHKDRKQLLWEAHLKLNKQKRINTLSLFNSQRKKIEIPQLNYYPKEDMYEQLEIMGFTLGNVFDLIEEKIEDEVLVKDFNKYVGKTINILGFLVTYKKTKTSTGKTMCFGNFLDREGQHIDTTLFPRVLEKYPFRGRAVYKIVGKLVDDYGHISIETISMKKINYTEDPRYTKQNKFKKAV